MRKPKYNTITFCDVWNSAALFTTDCKNADIPMNIKDQSITNLFYLLYARYGNNPIANFDVCQFKYKVFTTIFKYGGEWERKLEIQEKLRSLSEDDIMKAEEGVYNHANNPSVAPSTGRTEELPYVDDQTVQKRKRSKIDAYQFLWTALDSTISDDFLAKFEPCFAKFVDKSIEAVYCSDDEDEFEDEEE